MSKNLGDFMNEEEFDQAVIELLTLALMRLTCARVNDKGGVRHVASASYDAGIVASLMQQGLVEWKGTAGELDLTDDGFFFGDVAAARVGMALIGFLGFWSIAAAGVCVFIYTLGGIPVLVVLYDKIYQKDRKL